MAKNNDDRLSFIERLRQLMLEEEEDVTINLKGGDYTIEEYVVEDKKIPQDLLDWWYLNREWLLPYRIERKYAAKVTISGGDVSLVNEYYNTTGSAVNWVYTSQGQYNVTFTPSLNAVPVIISQSFNENTVGRIIIHSPSAAVMVRTDLDGNLADGSFFVEITVYD